MEPMLQVQEVGRATNLVGVRARVLAKPDRWRFRLLRTAPFLILLLCAYMVFAESVDDSYIVCRYSANLLDGHGPVFNVGERVEGFSSPLHMAMTAGLLRLAPEVDPLFKGKLLSLAFGLLAVYLTGRLARDLTLSEFGASIAMLLMALNVNFAIAAVNALETTLYTSLIILAVIALVREHDHGGYWSALFALLMLLSRPDAMILIGVFFAFQCVWPPPGPRAPRLARWSLLVGVPAGILLLLRILYYGRPLPNTFYAKDVNLVTGLTQGAQYLLRTLSPSDFGPKRWMAGRATLSESLQFVFAPCFWAAAAAGLLGRSRRHPAQFLLAGLICAQVVVVLKCGGDWMPGWRFLIPVLPAISVLQASAIQSLDGRRWKPGGRFGTGWLRSLSLRHRFGRGSVPVARVSRLSHIACACAVALWLLAFMVAPHRPWHVVRWSTRGEELLGASWVDSAKYIRDHLPHGASVAFSEMGYAPFINRDKRFIDMRGLTCRAVADVPKRLKKRFGVRDDQWFVPGSPLYAILVKERPDAIMADELFPVLLPKGVVLGDYTYTGTLSSPSDNDEWSFPPISVYVRQGGAAVGRKS